MAILDFIKQHRQQQAQVTSAQAVAQSAPVKQDVSKVLPASELAKAREVGERLKRATMHMHSANTTPDASSNEALRQRENNQDKVQSAMSPTDRFAGKTATQQRSRGWER